LNEEEQTTETTQEKPEGKPGPSEKRSILTGSEVIELTENVDYEYSPPEGSQPGSPEEQATAEGEPAAQAPKVPPNPPQTPSHENQETTQEGSEQQE